MFNRNRVNKGYLWKVMVSGASMYVATDSPIPTSGTQIVACSKYPTGEDWGGDYEGIQTLSACTVVSSEETIKVNYNYNITVKYGYSNYNWETHASEYVPLNITASFSKLDVPFEDLIAPAVNLTPWQATVVYIGGFEDNHSYAIYLEQGNAASGYPYYYNLATESFTPDAVGITIYVTFGNNI